ncbi:hypothetical protein FOYG_09249 [Fusarium oxysporum NRRL 32931]|uniref:Heterokaryon incompatibility domain-containing protein n=1 Tax=Fusarium oxysporum NRRL 32931 TaxID=660029 RepID=W9I3M3_FUSOX|nr:hypothetical protein FOYG_09249 [Fusarium oxysporum NRRL 32931]
MKPTTIPHAKPPSTNDQLCFTCNGMLVRPHHEIGLFDKFEERSGADISKSIEAGCRLCTMFGEVLKARQLPLSHAIITITLQLATINQMDFKVKQGMRADTMEKYSRINYLVKGCTGNNGSEKIDILLVPTDDQPVNWPPAPVRKLPDFPLSLSTNSNSNENTKCWVDEVRSTSKFLDVYGRWMNFIENFSHCHLTMERDKLPAIAGVAAVVQLPDDQYLAGLWRSGLASQLIWRRSEKRWADYELPRDYRGQNSTHY